MDNGSQKEYEPYQTSKYPEKKLAILTCMDTRLIELLPAVLGIRNGDAKIIKNAGGVITHPLMPKDVVIRGYIMDSVTGELHQVS